MPLCWLVFAASILACGQLSVAHAEDLAVSAAADSSQQCDRPVGSGPDVISDWNELAVATINQPADSHGTPSEQLPIYSLDLATVQAAVYDAVVAICGKYRLFGATPHARVVGASPEAAAGEAAFRTLRGLFPGSEAMLQVAHDKFLRALPPGSARDLGLAVGAEVAAGMLTLRADDGRLAPMPSFQPGTGPGQFRGPIAVARTLPGVKPFALASNDQFQAPGPPSLSSSTYAADFDETRLLGGARSASRTVTQAETALFHSEPPNTFWPRNLRVFAMGARGLADRARLMATIWVTHADATVACFASKYRFLFWRPESAIPEGDRDGNDATVADPRWTPALHTPPHPEYPAAHACVTGALAEVIREYDGPSSGEFVFTSTATGSTHRYSSGEALVEEVVMARIAGGMHFRSSLQDGVAMGRSVARWDMAHRFQRQ